MAVLDGFNLGRTLLARRTLGLVVSVFHGRGLNRLSSFHFRRGIRLNGRGAIIAIAARAAGPPIGLLAIAIAVVLMGALAFRLPIETAFLGLEFTRPDILDRALLQFAIHVRSVVIIAIAIIVAVATPALLFFLPRAIVGENAKVMIRELQIIFGVHPVTLRLGIARQVLVFLKKLGRIAARTIVDAIARIAAPAVTLRARVVPAATAAGLTIIDQR